VLVSLEGWQGKEAGGIKEKQPQGTQGEAF
jgi:hypothetical protein